MPKNKQNDANQNETSEDQQADTAQEQATAAPKVPGVAVARKLSVATVYGKVKVKDIPTGGQVHVMRIAGTASDSVSGESAFGRWESLKGEFAAINIETGERFVGVNAFVPGALGEMLIEQVKAGVKEDVGFSLKFSVDVFVTVSPRDENKYEYVTKPVIETTAGNQALLLLDVN